MSDSKIARQDAESPPADGTARSETRLPRSLRIFALATPFVVFLGILAGKGIYLDSGNDQQDRPVGQACYSVGSSAACHPCQ